MKIRTFLLVVSAGLIVPACVLAADAPVATSPPPAAAAQKGPKAEAFQKTYAQWQTLINDLGQLQIKYRKALPAERPPLKEQFQKLITQGEVLEPQLIEAAQNAYVEAPNADVQITQFLIQVMLDSVQNDNYERAMPLCQLLIKHGAAEKLPGASADANRGQLYNMAGFSAFALADWDTAEQFLKKAQELNALNEKTQHVLPSIPHYREAWKKEKALREAEAKADDLPRILMKTTKGDIEIELFENEAPNAVANFISLVEKKFYDGLTFHRVLENFMAQGGCPTGDGSGGPGYSIACECYQPNHRIHFRGSLSMAHAGRDTGGSQFFLTFLPTTHLDGKHTVFGRVIKGFDVLAKLQRRNPDDPSQTKADKMTEVKVLRKRPHEYVVKKVE